MLNVLIEMVPYIPTISVIILFIIVIYYNYKLISLQKMNNNIYIDTSPKQLYGKIYTITYLNPMDLKEHLKIAYQEYQHQTSLLQSKISFFFTLQAIFGGLFTFIYKEVCIYNNIFSYIPIMFGLATFLLFSNMENTNNKITNIKFYIFKLEKLIDHPLMNFFENGFYKQNFDSDRNILTLFIIFISIAWVFIGVYFLFLNYFIAFIASYLFLIMIIHKQYKAQKSYGFDDDKMKK